MKTKKEIRKTNINNKILSIIKNMILDTNFKDDIRERVLDTKDETPDSNIFNNQYLAIRDKIIESISNMKI